MSDDAGQMSPQMGYAIQEIRRLMRENGFAGAVVLISAEEASVHVSLSQKWNGVEQAGDILAVGFKPGETKKLAATKHMAGVLHEVASHWAHGAETMLEIIERHSERIVKPVPDLPDEKLPHADAAKDMLTNLIHLNRKDRNL